ncbi:helix-turn-helix domain-containing protein [Zooshikella ganghwensis]|uniref:Helix-turn-helix domain containing protein n=1 Tax=Zooshikella ganghwensis TaxID=202772 RepID=A0A4P9VHX0_9GAMM|nr:helix-turn-helix domain-containing protein [Zooshikella ganghwensis]RDH42029.1 helix-turn-helix domain containing protein [Zooshikella ganghwensis]
MTKTYRLMALKERYQISAYLAAGFTRSAITEKLGPDKSSISREINRNIRLRGYYPKQAPMKKL